MEYANYVLLRKPNDKSRTSSGDDTNEVCQHILNMVVSETARTRRTSSGNKKYVESEDEEDPQPSARGPSSKKGAAARRSSSRRAAVEVRKRQRSTKGRDGEGDEVVVAALTVPEASPSSRQTENFSDGPSTSRQSRRYEKIY